jgi:predicted GNAT family N-acyltransferase
MSAPSVRPAPPAVSIRAVDGPALREAAFALRHAVFVGEQRVPEALERDEHDDGAFHAVALAPDGAVVATGRLVRQPDGTGRVGRMAVAPAWRRAGLGARVLAALEAEARARGMPAVELHAQCYVEGFYARAGYARAGEPFAEAGIDHVVMRKAL